MADEAEAIELLKQHRAELFTKILKIPSDCRDFKQIALAFDRNLPFQNVTLLALPDSEKRPPTLVESVEMVLSGKGGLCYTLNPVMKCLLDLLGYKASLLCGTIKNRWNSHCGVLLEHEGAKFLIDIGIFMFSMFLAVRLDFDEISEVFECSYGLQIRFRFNKEKNLIIREHKNAPWDPEKGDWAEFVRFSLHPVSFESFRDRLASLVYCPPHPGVQDLSSHVVMMRLGSNGRLIGYKKNNKIFELESGEIQNQKYNSAEMLKKAIAEDFPEIPFREISLAVDKTWNSDSSA